MRSVYVFYVFGCLVRRILARQARKDIPAILKSTIREIKKTAKVTAPIVPRGTGEDCQR